MKKLRIKNKKFTIALLINILSTILFVFSWSVYKYSYEIYQVFEEEFNKIISVERNVQLMIDTAKSIEKFQKTQAEIYYIPDYKEANEVIFKFVDSISVAGFNISSNPYVENDRIKTKIYGKINLYNQESFNYLLKILTNNLPLVEIKDIKIERTDNELKTEANLFVYQVFKNKIPNK